MNVEFGDTENRVKKRVTKKMKANFAEDQGFAPSLGSTVGDAKSFDGLESACEEIETKGQLVANQLERDEVLRLQHPTEFSPPAGIAGFHAAVKKGLTALKKTNFNGLPRSDIASLESYLERLSAFDFETKLTELLANFAPGPAGDQFPEEPNIRAAMDQITTAIERVNRAMREENRRIAHGPGQLVGMTAPKKREHEGIIYRLEEEKKGYEHDLADAERALARGLQPISTKATRAGLIEKDTALVVPEFKVFLQSLANGLQSYKSGVSGKNVIVGSGSYHCVMGGAEYLPRRFL